MFRKNKYKDGEGFEVGAPVSMDLAGLIKNQNWHSVLTRLDLNPHEAEEELRVTTRGGFVSTTGFFPLHYACERRPPPEVVDALIAACPAAVTTRTMPGGSLPLHIACTWYAPLGSLNTLLMADRSTCKVQDELGNVPLHSACFSGTASHVVECLLRSYPKASLARNHQGSLPEDICKRLRHDNRRSLMALLNLCKDEVLSGKHSRSNSSGTMGRIAASAIALNERCVALPCMTTIASVDAKETADALFVSHMFVLCLQRWAPIVSKWARQSNVRYQRTNNRRGTCLDLGSLLNQEYINRKLLLVAALILFHFVLQQVSDKRHPSTIHHA